MARARNIKPSFFKNEGLGELPIGARMLFIGLWTLGDREGRLEDRPARMGAELFPYDRQISVADVDSWLTLLAESPERFIVRYRHGASRFIQITNFTKHQAPHIREQKSTIPAPDSPDDAGIEPLPDMQEDSTSTNLGDDLHRECPDEHQTRRCVAPPDSLNPSSLNPDVPIKALRRKESTKPTTNRGTRFVRTELPQEWRLFALSYMHWDIEKTQAVYEDFMDHWTAKTGTDATKLDWLATWRRWCRTKTQWEKPAARNHDAEWKALENR